MKEMKTLLWDIFDGDGGDGGADGASASFGAEGGQGDVQIEYGVPQDPSSRFGSDSGSDDHQQTVDEEFAQLIGKGGKYEQQYGRSVAQAVQNRFRNQADLQEVIGGYEAAISPLMQKYGLEAGDIEGLAEAIAGDDDIYARAAELEGVSTERYRQDLQMQAELERSRSMLNEFQRNKMYGEKFAEWDMQAAELQEAFPNFDLDRELAENEDFRELLDTGRFDVRRAFFAVHADDILAGQEEYARRSQEQTVADRISRAARRPVENGMQHQAAVVRKTDPSKLTDDDMDKIFEIAQNGGKVSF